MRHPTDDKNLAETEIANISNDAELLDRATLQEKMRAVGVKTKKEYVRYMIALHGKKR